MSLFDKHPLPWRVEPMALGQYVVDANGYYVDALSRLNHILDRGAVEGIVGALNDSDALRARVAVLDGALRDTRPIFEHDGECGIYVYRWDGKSKCNCRIAKVIEAIDAALADGKEGAT
jgi:hypothetical protein